jgi:hypothetical protein
MDAENYNGLRFGAVDISYGLDVGEPVTQPPKYVHATIAGLAPMMDSMRCGSRL